MLDTDIKDDFLDLFYPKEYSLENNNKLNTFILKIKNNSFSYDELVDLLGDKLCYFALSRTEVKSLEDCKKYNTLIKKAKNKLRNYNVNDGELGEILLYCFLESHLNAPKILTKLELKTSNNLYVNGADGVHLLKINSTDYKLILGESKLKSDLKAGVTESFKSLFSLIDNNLNKLNFEIDLVNSQLIKESYDENMYNILKKIIIPSAKEDETYLDYSFGIFLGFDIEITDNEKELSNSDFRSAIREKIHKIIESSINSINLQIKSQKFQGYSFYVYIVPFSDLDANRKK
jgi:hypothetical protein